MAYLISHIALAHNPERCRYAKNLRLPSHLLRPPEFFQEPLPFEETPMVGRYVLFYSPTVGGLLIKAVAHGLNVAVSV